MAKQRSRAGQRWAVVALVALGCAWLLIRPTGHDRVLSQLRRAAAAVAIQPDETLDQRRTRITQVFEEVFDPWVVAKIPDLPDAGGGRQRLIEAACATGTGYTQAELVLEQPSVRLEASGQRARAQARALLSGSSPSAGLRTDEREVQLLLRKVGSTWRVVALNVAAPSSVEPEARP